MDDLQIIMLEEDITKGIPLASRLCPLARCIGRALTENKEGSWEEIIACPFGIYIDDIRYETNRVIQEFMGDFDQGKTVEPLELQVDFVFKEIWGFHIEKENPDKAYYDPERKSWKS